MLYSKHENRRAVFFWSVDGLRDAWDRYFEGETLELMGVGNGGEGKFMAGDIRTWQKCVAK